MNKKFRVVVQKKVVMRTELEIEAPSQFSALTTADAMIKNGEVDNAEWEKIEAPIKAISVHDE